MRIGIIGTRGIPNQYGGYEQFVEFAAPLLVKNGHDVYVYNSSLHPYQQSSWKGVNIIKKYDPENKIGTAGQFIYDLNCILDCRQRHFDVILQLGYTSSSVWTFLFPKSSVVITNMDGLEWKRSKYSKYVQNFLKKAEQWAVLNSDVLIADSKGIQKYLLDKYNKTSVFIPYGADLVYNADEKLLVTKGVNKFEYCLAIARMEPENNVETIIKGYLLADNSKPLIIIGNYKNAFGTQLMKKYASDLIQFWGPVYDIAFLNSLRHYAYLYFHGHSVGGTNPSLLEAMASFVPIVAHKNIFNETVLEKDAFYFTQAEDIADLLHQELDKFCLGKMVENNAVKIRELYSWDYIIELLENCLLHAVNRK